MKLSSNKDKIAIVVGKGDLPYKVIKEAIAKNLNFIVVGIKGNSPKKLVNTYNNFWFHMGEVADFIAKLKNNNITKVVFVGSVVRPSLLSLKLDSLGKKFVKEYFSKIKGDDSLLSIVIKELESYGFEVIGAHDIASDILAKKKVYTKISPNLDQLKEIQEAFLLTKKLSAFDIGQSVIFQQNIIIAVEGVEGTAKTILRSKSLIKKSSKLINILKKIIYLTGLLNGTFLFFKKLFTKKEKSSYSFVKNNIQSKDFKDEKSNLEGAFLVKIKKVNQESRVDLPTIGDKTIIQVKKAGIIGIVIEAGSTIILNEKKTINLANKYGIFIIAL